MISEDSQLKMLADEYQVGIEEVRALLAAWHAQVGAGQFYVFWTSGTGGGMRRSASLRTVLAFQTPDGALAFAQRNRLTVAPEQPRLRRLSLLQLLHVMLREPAIVAILFVVDQDMSPLPLGYLPPGVRMVRSDIVQRLRPRSV